MKGGRGYFQILTNVLLHLVITDIILIIVAEMLYKKGSHDLDHETLGILIFGSLIWNETDKSVIDSGSEIVFNKIIKAYFVCLK